MRYYFKQKAFSWFDSYDIYNEDGGIEYKVRGELSWGHQQRIYDKYGNEVGLIKQRLFTFLPKFDIYMEGNYLGYIIKEFTFFKPVYTFSYNEWRIRGNFMEWDYTIQDDYGTIVANISKELFHFTDHYVIDVDNEEDGLIALLFVLAVDIEKCTRESNS